MQKKLDKIEFDKIKVKALKFKKVQEEYKALEKEKDELSKDLRNFMFVNGISEFDFEKESLDVRSIVTVKNIKKVTVTFDADKLEKRFDKELCNEFIEKKYEINNIEGLVKYLKSCGVDPKEFKKYINVEKKVNNKKLDEISNLGDITEEDLKGCFTMEESVGYIKITEAD